jgi:hypothetical protein
LTSGDTATSSVHCPIAWRIIDDGDRGTKKREERRDKAHKPRPAPRPR